MADAGFSTSALWFDYDNDGKLDLFVAHYVDWSIEKDLFCTLDGKSKSYCTPESYKGQSPTLYHNRGDGTFEDVTRRAGLYDPTSKGLGVAMLDFDGDGRMDLFVANDTQPNRLYRNKGDGTFADAAVAAGVAFSEAGVARAGMGVDAADYDDSGRPSLIIGNFSNEMMALYHNEGTGLFIDEAPRSAIGRASLLTLTFGCFFFDYDLDGRPDIFAANGHVADDIERVQSRVTYAQRPHLFHNLGRNAFEEATPQAGAALQAKLVGRGAAYADIDNDGDLDVLVTANNGPARLFRNDGGNRNNAIRIRTIGTRSNRDGIGARVEVSLRGGGEAMADREDRVELRVAKRAAADLRSRRGDQGRGDARHMAEWPGRHDRAARGQPDRDGPGRRGRRRRDAAPIGARRPSMKRRWRAALVCLLLGVAGASGQPARENAYRANNLGVALLEQFSYKAAADAFREALRIDPSLALAHINLSIALLYVPDLDGAARAAADAARLLPGTAAAELPAGPHRSRAKPNRRRDCRVPARAPDRSARRREQTSTSARSTCSSAATPTRSRCFVPALAEEPYNVTATYNLALALDTCRPDRRRPAGHGTLSGPSRQRLRHDVFQYLPGARAIRRGHRLDPRGIGCRRSGVSRCHLHARRQSSAHRRARHRARIAVRPPLRRSTIFRRTASERSRRDSAEGSTLADIDGDGDLDLVAASAAGQRLLRNDGGKFVDVTRDAGLGISPPDAVAIGCIAADYDNDGRPDIFVLRYGGSSLYHNSGNLHFSDATARSGIPPYPFVPSSAAFVDVDHDGDLDLIVVGIADPAGARARAAARTLTFPGDFPGAPIQLLRNNGNGTFTDIASAAGFKTTTHAIAAVPTDFDNRRDIDLLIVNADAPPLLFKNLRDGTFRNVAAEVGLQRVDGPVTSVAAGDINKDDYPDFFFGRADAPGLFAVSDGRGHFTVTAAPDASRSAACRAVGRLRQRRDARSGDVVQRRPAAAPQPRHAVGRGEHAAVATPAAARPAPVRMFAAGDVDLDGAIDLVHGRSVRGGFPLSQRRRCAQPVAARAVERTGEQSLGDRLENPDPRRQPGRADRNVGRDAAGRARRCRVRARPPDGRRCGARVVAVGSPAGRNRRGDAGAGVDRLARLDRRARSQAIVVSLPVHLERRAIRVRHRLHGGRRDGLLGSARPPQHARRDRIRPHSR